MARKRYSPEEDHLDSDIERLSRINHTLSLLSEAQLAATPLRPIRAVVIRPSQDIRDIAARHVAEISWAVRMLMRGIGGWGGDWRLPSYLNFDGAYCRELIALGYRDAWTSGSEIVDLLSGAKH